MKGLIIMDNLQMKRLGKACQLISDSLSAATKYLDDFVNGALKEATKNAEAENVIAAASNYDFVHALRPVARELAELTGKRYIDILDQALEMLLEGKDIPDVLYHFDRVLYDLKHGRK